MIFNVSLYSDLLLKRLGVDKMFFFLVFFLFFFCFGSTTSQK